MGFLRFLPDITLPLPFELITLAANYSRSAYSARHSEPCRSCCRSGLRMEDLVSALPPQPSLFSLHCARDT